MTMTPGDIVILIHGARPELLLFFWRSVADPLDLLNQNVLLALAIEMAACVAFHRRIQHCPTMSQTYVLMHGS